jgi:hypothetical protein
MVAEDESRRSEAVRAVRITAGVNRIKSESPVFFALVAAAPDRETLQHWLVDRFRVEPDVAEAVLHQSVLSMMPKR